MALGLFALESSVAVCIPAVMPLAIDQYPMMPSCYGIGGQSKKHRSIDVTERPLNPIA